MNASQIQGKICRFCKQQGVYYNKIISASHNGIPDVMIVIAGITYWFEVKAKDTKDRLRPEQEAVISKLNESKKIAYIIRTYEDFLDIYKTLTEIKLIEKPRTIWSISDEEM